VTRCALTAGLLVASVCAASERRALVFGDNLGTSADTPLRFAEADAQATAAALTEVGAVGPQQLILIRDGPALAR
jgi:hypothetical protein